jgi:hypothetical protein
MCERRVAVASQCRSSHGSPPAQLRHNPAPRTANRRRTESMTTAYATRRMSSHCLLRGRILLKGELPCIHTTRWAWGTCAETSSSRNRSPPPTPRTPCFCTPRVRGEELRLSPRRGLRHLPRPVQDADRRLPATPTGHEPRGTASHPGPDAARRSRDARAGRLHRRQRSAGGWASSIRRSSTFIFEEILRRPRD